MLKFDFSYKFQSDRPQFLRYIIDGTSYYIPYFGIIPKIIDFGYSSLPEEGIMSNAINDKSIMYHRSNNDLLFLFHWIYATLSVTGGDKLGYVDDLLSALEPTRSYIHFYTEFIRKNEDTIPTYEDMIKNKVFFHYKNNSVLDKDILKSYG